MRLHTATRIVIIATVLAPLLSGCGKSRTPPRVYTAATTGSSSVENLVDDFKKAYAAHDADAAMQMFFWQSADDQYFWWVELNDIFASPYDAIAVVPPQAESESEHPPPTTTLPVVARMHITTNTTKTSTGSTEEIHTLLIGKNERGFYFVPPVND